LGYDSRNVSILSGPPGAVAYFNGEIVPATEVRVSYRDTGFLFGYGGFDTTRTFERRIFRLEAHLGRFYRTLRYLHIDPGLSRADLALATEEVLRRNLPLLPAGQDYWVTQRVSGGVYGSGIPTVIIDCILLPLAERESRSPYPLSAAHRRGR
jgi:branched-chain amino acid aminotransferase